MRGLTADKVWELATQCGLLTYDETQWRHPGAMKLFEFADAMYQHGLATAATQFTPADSVTTQCNNTFACRCSKHYVTSTNAQSEPVATKLETQPFNCFHVSAEDAEKLRALPVGTKLYTSPVKASEERDSKRLDWLEH